MDPLRSKWWGPKHIGSSYFCELSLHTEFQSPNTYPSGRKVTTLKKKKKEKWMMRIMATCSKSKVRELVPKVIWNWLSEVPVAGHILSL